MRGFTARRSVADTLEWIDANARRLPAETIPLAKLSGRVLAEPVVSRVDVPGFSRAMMDGYAVRATDTHGASTYNPLPLRCRGVILPGSETQLSVQPGECVRIMTGAALPPGADAVLPAESTRATADVRRPNETVVQAMGEVSPGKHVGQPGEDIRRGVTVAEAGRRLRPQDLGVLSSVGCSEASVIRRPQVRLVVTGDELLPPGSPAQPPRIADANSPMLTALIERDGGIVLNEGLLPDQPERIREQLQDENCDVVLVAGGSSVGQEDHAPMLLAQLGELAIHGVAIRPSSPAGMGRIGEKPIFLLPGNPVSCLCAYDMFAARAIRLRGGRTADWPYPSRRLPLARKLVSQIGRVDYARVRILDGQVEPLAISGASVLSSTTRADGFVLIDADSEGKAGGAEVQVWLYDHLPLATPGTNNA